MIRNTAYYVPSICHKLQSGLHCAALGLLTFLGKSNANFPSRAVRKRCRENHDDNGDSFFSDYDVLEASSDDDNTFNDDEKDPDVTMYGVKKQKIKREPPPLASPFMMRKSSFPV